MKFRSAVLATPVLEGHYREGLQALRHVDRSRVKATNTRRIQGSVDLDSALSGVVPNAPTWDYGIGYAENRNKHHAIWLEVHPATSGRNVMEVRDKLEWLRAWLPKSAPALRSLATHYVWVATGRVAINRNTPQYRQIAQLGLLFRARQVDLDEVTA
jgi:hypothetical protein